MRSFIAATLGTLCLGGCGLAFGQQQGVETYRDGLEPSLAALDRGDVSTAAKLLDQRLASAGQTGDDPDHPLLLLESAMVQLALGDPARASKDLAAADGMLEVLSLDPDASGEAAQWFFSETTKRYRAPAYEKLMVNVLGIVARLQAGDVKGARVEARRLHALDRLFTKAKAEEAKRDPGGVRAVGRLLAGLTFELSGRKDIARRWYEEAADAAAIGALDPPETDLPEAGELMVIILSGRVPARRVGRTAGVNIVELGPSMTIDALAVSIGKTGDKATPKLIADIEATARKVYQEARPTLVAAAKNRKALRDGASKAMGANQDLSQPIGGAAGMAKALGAIAAKSMVSSLESVDIPDTRSWHTLPSQIHVLRVALAPGTHPLVITRGKTQQDYDVPIHEGRRSLVVAVVP